MSMQYQDFILEEFRSRRSRNPNYSLRAFARDLGMPASKLSQNLRGLCGISVAKAEKIAGCMHMHDDEKQLFLALVESQHARSRVAREQAQSALQRICEDRAFDELTLEKFSAIRDWYHMAILEMTDIKGFRADVDWIAGKLGLPVNLVRDAVERLQVLGMLQINDDGWKQTYRDAELPCSIPSRALREHHKQLMAKGIAAIDVAEGANTEYSTQTFAVDKRLLPEIKIAAREFQRRIGKITAVGQKDAVFVMAVQLFPLIDSADN